MFFLRINNLHVLILTILNFIFKFESIENSVELERFYSPRVWQARVRLSSLNGYKSTGGLQCR